MLSPTHRLSDQIPMRCQIIPGIKCRIKCWIADFVNLNRYWKMGRFTIPHQTWTCVATIKRRNSQLFSLKFGFISNNLFNLKHFIPPFLAIQKINGPYRDAAPPKKRDFWGIFPKGGGGLFKSQNFCKFTKCFCQNMFCNSGEVISDQFNHLILI